MSLSLKRSLIFAAASAVAAFFTSCAAVDDLPPMKANRVLYHWYDDTAATGKVKVKIDLTEQKAHILRSGQEIGWCYVATGKEGHGTPSGSYTITEKIVDKYSNAYGWIEDEQGNVVNGDAKPSTRVPKGCRYVPAPMPYWMRLTSYGIGMHVGIIPVPGEPASHGCIRMPHDFVPDLFNMVEIGTPVQIVR